jgi:hypothetical protein
MPVRSGNFPLDWLTRDKHSNVCGLIKRLRRLIHRGNSDEVQGEHHWPHQQRTKVNEHQMEFHISVFNLVANRGLENLEYGELAATTEKLTEEPCESLQESLQVVFK